MNTRYFQILMVCMAAVLQAACTTRTFSSQGFNVPLYEALKAQTRAEEPNEHKPLDDEIYDLSQRDGAYERPKVRHTWVADTGSERRERVWHRKNDGQKRTRDPRPGSHSWLVRDYSTESEAAHRKPEGPTSLYVPGFGEVSVEEPTFFETWHPDGSVTVCQYPEQVCTVYDADDLEGEDEAAMVESIPPAKEPGDCRAAEEAKKARGEAFWSCDPDIFNCNEYPFECSVIE